MHTASTWSGTARPPSDGQTVEAVYAAAYDLLQRERYADAAGVFRLMLRIARADDRGWLGLSECHERAGQSYLALEIITMGVLAGRLEARPSARCALARARLLAKLDRDDEATAAFDEARDLAEAAGDEPLLELVTREERRGAA